MNLPGRGWIAGVIGTLVLMGALLGPPPACADNGDLRRILVGTKLFAAFLAADLDIAKKSADDGRLHLIILHRNDEATTAAVAERLSAIGTVRGIPLAVDIVKQPQLGETKSSPAAVFVAEWLPDLSPVTAFAAKHQTLLFSPILGDMERGVHGGLHVSDRILPVVNTAALARDGIRIKPFFLEVARRYEE